MHQSFDADAKWIWVHHATRTDSTFGVFRRQFHLAACPTGAVLRVTADARYELFVNGRWLGHGPVRGWLSPWSVDEYALGSELTAGPNVIAIQVHHFGVGTNQYLPADPGLLAQLDWHDGHASQRLVTDDQWRAIEHDAFAWPAPQVSFASTWEEQFDARHPLFQPVDWREPSFDDASWPRAQVMRSAGQPPHEDFALRDIPMLTRDPAPPQRIVSVDAVKPASNVWSLLLRDFFNDHHAGSGSTEAGMLVATHIHSPCDQSMALQDPHELSVWCNVKWKLNGQPITGAQSAGYPDDGSMQWGDHRVIHTQLKRGWNVLMGRILSPLGTRRAVITTRTPHPISFCATPSHGDASASNWLRIGPGDRYQDVWTHGTITPEDLAGPCTHPLSDEHVTQTDVFAIAMSDEVIPDAAPRLDSPDAMLSDDQDWTTVYPSPQGDARVLLDFGRQIIGFHEFEVDAPEGTIIDCHNFEFIQKDGRHLLCEGMNNTFRYTCRGGIQRYRTQLRRGLRFSHLIFRNHAEPVRVRFVRVLKSVYPGKPRGRFACSDSKLTAIWRTGVHTLECCSEDTYTDCPTYEQAFWTGDARNEALVDLISRGDARLSERCLRLSAKSLDRSPLVEAIVPNAEPVVIPAWSFLWMRWVCEHYLLTGDKSLAHALLPNLVRNIEGIEKHINQDGLFEIDAWNMFDWAEMDTPGDGVVTHNNCMAVLALRQCVAMARSLGRSELIERCTRLGEGIKDAVNRHLWNEQVGGYADCLRSDGMQSPVFSQQTHTTAYLSGVAEGDRRRRCRQVMLHPPADYVRGESPFFMSFLLEALALDHDTANILHLIRDYWGKQIDDGATSFWETYTRHQSRPTRSHCHGWSSSPSYILSHHVLGIRPLTPGYATVEINPQTTALDWAQGQVPTPHGDVAVAWKHSGDQLFFELILPEQVSAQVTLPVAGTLNVERGQASSVRVTERHCTFHTRGSIRATLGSTPSPTQPTGPVKPPPVRQNRTTV